MPPNLGWNLRGWYGEFMSAATAVFALGLLFIGAAELIVARYEARKAAGIIELPAFRTIQETDSVPVLGANIGEVANADNLKSLKAALKIAVPDLPWRNALSRRSARGTTSRVVSLFFPADGVRDAFALCAKLIEVPLPCAPAIAASDELALANGAPATEAALARLGVTPYRPNSRFATPKVVEAEQPRPQPTLPSPVVQQPPAQLAAAILQPPLRLQPGIASPGVPEPGGVMWLSSKVQPGSAGLVRVVAAGDTMMGSSTNALNPDIRAGVDAASLVGAPLVTLFRRADIGFLNLEGPLYDGGEDSPKSCANCFAFRSPTRYADVVANLGIDVVSLANNHSGDFGEAGRESTMAALKARGIAYAGLNRDGARTAELVLAGGRTAALIAFAPNSGTLNLNDVPGAVALVRQLRKNHNLVIVSFHGGAEGWTNVHVPKAHEIFYGEDRGDVMAFAHAVIDAGADLVIGHGPHVPRAMEIYKDRLIAYSLGNFWTYNGVQNYAVSGLGPVLEAYLAPDGSIAGVAVHSSRQAGLGVPRLDALDEAGRYVLYLTKSDFPGTAARLNSARRISAAAINPGS